MTSIARKFERFLKMYRHSDGRRWGGQELHDATGGVVTRSYVTNLRKGRVRNPGYEKLAAIAKAMGFPPSLWFEVTHDLNATVRIDETGNDRSLSGRVNSLFNSVTNEKTGEPYTNAEVARMSFGDLTVEEVAAMRFGSNADPSLNKVVALADVFGVDPSYFFNSSERTPIIDPQMLDIFRNETVSAIARKSLKLPDHEKRTILGIISQFENMHETHRGD